MLLEFEHGVNHLVESWAHFFMNAKSHNDGLGRCPLVMFLSLFVPLLCVCVSSLQYTDG